MSLRSEGKTAAASLIKEIQKSPSRANKIAKVWKANKDIPLIKPYSSREALGLMLDMNISRNSYQTMRNQAKTRGANIYPSYKKVREAKIECYPAEHKMKISEQSCEVELQALLDLTTTRILELQEDVIKTIEKKNLENLELISKWGFDGSSQSQYKQKIQGEDFSDKDLLMTTLVPLQLRYVDTTGKIVILWQNPRPSSTRFCRPIRIQFVKETADVIKKEKQYIQSQIDFLKATNIKDDIKVRQILILSMIDGKVHNAISYNSCSQKCNLCGASQKDMNNIGQMIKLKPNEDALKYGLSSLHAYIRFLEWLLHVSYRLPITSWHVKKDQKDLVEERKRCIQNKLRKELGLSVDFVKQGYGTSNNGNTARTFFSNSSNTSKITELNESLILRCDTILRTLSCGYEVDSEKYHKFALETAKIYVELYPWYPMPPSIHKTLLHGSNIISVALLPIGMLSEEAQEARNKDFRMFREKRCRKNSRMATNVDLIHIMLVSSDPIISFLRLTPPRKGGSLPKRVLDLLKMETPTSFFSDSEGESD